MFVPENGSRHSFMIVCRPAAAKEEDTAMKNWLELIPISAKVHKRGSRMTGTCIALAVFLMAALFGMADRYLQGERTWQIHTYGSWQFTGDGDASQIYAVALFLALLVMAADVLMISGSLNGNVLQRTEFFGMLRCLGATRRQILRFVRLEALCWCRTAVPAGLFAAAAAVCLVSALMKTAGPERLSYIPVRGVSLPGTCTGAALGVLTVLLASRVPAKRAAQVSPLEAVRTAGRMAGNRRKTARFREFRPKTDRFLYQHPEAALGIRHAFLVKKGYVLMSGAFALCIVLFLAFTTVADFLAHALLPPPWTPELSVVSADNTCSIPRTAADAVLQMDGVKRVYGRMFAYNISMTAEKTEETGRTPSGQKKANLISYEENQFAWAEESLTAGSVKAVSENPGQVLYVAPPEEMAAEKEAVAAAEMGAGERAGGAAETGAEEGAGGAAETNGGAGEKASSPQISVGDRLTLVIGDRKQTVTVAGILSESPLARQEGTATLLVSERTFLELTGEEGYNILDIQFENGADRESVEAVKAYFTEGVTFEDSFDRMQAQKRLYRAMAILAWGFLAVIVGITVLHVANTIRMNAEAGKRQYGILRAVGLDGGQLFGMLAAQALSYAAGGCLMGWLLGIPVQRVLFLSLITSFWQDAWSLPLLPLAGITGIVLVSSLFAVVRPFRSLMRMSVVDVINRRQG